MGRGGEEPILGDPNLSYHYELQEATREKGGKYKWDGKTMANEYERAYYNKKACRLLDVVKKLLQCKGSRFGNTDKNEQNRKEPQTGRAAMRNIHGGIKASWSRHGATTWRRHGAATVGSKRRRQHGASTVPPRRQHGAAMVG